MLKSILSFLLLSVLLMAPLASGSHDIKCAYLEECIRALQKTSDGKDVIDLSKYQESMVIANDTSESAKGARTAFIALKTGTDQMFNKISPYLQDPLRVQLLEHKEDQLTGFTIKQWNNGLHEALVSLFRENLDCIWIVVSFLSEGNPGFLAFPADREKGTFYFFEVSLLTKKPLFSQGPNCEDFAKYLAYETAHSEYLLLSPGMVVARPFKKTALKGDDSLPCRFLVGWCQEIRYELKMGC